MWRSLLKTILLLPVILVAWHTLVRIIRRFYKFLHEGLVKEQ